VEPSTRSIFDLTAQSVIETSDDFEVTAVDEATRLILSKNEQAATSDQ
jgi:hypothetical protein